MSKTSSQGFKTGYHIYDIYDRKQFLPDIRESLKKLHTKQLMDLRISSLGREDQEMYKLIREELATRPHVPNKLERRISRKQKMKERQNR